MDPLTVIATALVAGAAATLKDTAKQVVKDAYTGLKGLIARKFGSGANAATLNAAMTLAEQKPGDKPRQELLQDELRSAKANEDAEVVKQAQALLDLIKQLEPNVSTQYQVSATGDGAAAVGPGAKAVGKGGVLVEGNVSGGINTGTQTTVSTGGGTYVAGDFVISTMSELDRIDSSTRKRLMSRYQTQLQKSPKASGLYLALGLFYLDQKLYSMAVSSLMQAHTIVPDDPNTLYYLAVATIGGRRPKTLKLSDIKAIESYVEAAIQLDGNRAHYLYLWALLDYDYYLLNGLTPPGADVNDIREQAQLASFDPSEIAHLLRHVPVPSNPITDAMMRHR